MSNVIELVSRWREEGTNGGATAGLSNMKREMTALVNVIGIGAGFGAIASVNLLTQALVKLVQLPGQAANEFAKLAREGRNSEQVFKDLARAQDEAAAAWERFREKLAKGAAPGEISNAQFSKRVALGLAGYNYYQQDLAEEALGITGPGGGSEFGQYRKNPQRDAADRKAINQTIIEEAAAREKRAEAIRKENAALAERAYNSVYRGFDVYGPQQRSQEELLQGFSNQTGPMSNLWDKPDALVDVGARIASGLTSIAGSFVSGIMTIGQAFKAFWQDLIGTIVGEAAKAGLGWLLGAIGTAIGGPIGGFVGGIGGKLLGKSSAGAGRGGPTLVFQGLNTRDMYMAVSGNGSLARANDLQRMRMELA